MTILFPSWGRKRVMFDVDQAIKDGHYNKQFRALNKLHQIIKNTRRHTQ